MTVVVDVTDATPLIVVDVTETAVTVDVTEGEQIIVNVETVGGTINESNLVTQDELTAALVALNLTTLRFDQDVASTLWTIHHNLSEYPSVTVSVGGEEVDAQIDYVDANTVTVGFTIAVTGSAFLN